MSLPVTNGIGISKHTPYKQRFFTRFIWAHMAAHRKEIVSNRKARYYYFDMNAGAGVYKGTEEEMILGSPLLFLMNARYSVRIPFYALFCEADMANCKRLAANTRLLFSLGAISEDEFKKGNEWESTTEPRRSEWELIAGTDTDQGYERYRWQPYVPGGREVPEDIDECFTKDSQGYISYRCASTRHKGDTYVTDSKISSDLKEEAWLYLWSRELAYITLCDSSQDVPHFSSDIFPLGKKHGLLYLDPNGIFLPVALLTRMDKKKDSRNIDFLINLAAGTYKRVRRNPKTRLKEPLDEVLRKTGKQVWYISRPHGSQQWTFLYGTRDNPESLKSLGLHNIDHPTGKRLLLELSYTVEERGGEIVASY